MKILHCCLAAFYIDNFSYQENVLPRLHKKAGHEVMILTSTETYTKEKKLGYVEASSYYTAEGIPVRRIPYTSWLPKFFKRKLRIYKGVKETLDEFKPDLIFMHDGQTYASLEIAAYVKQNPGVKLIMDSHTDYVNSATNCISMNILHKIVYRYFVSRIATQVDKLYGTLPIRMDFYRDIYKFPTEKISFLPFGFDTSMINFSQREDIRTSVRKCLGLDKSDFVLISGGKIDYRKNIHILLETMGMLNNNNIKLILFGTPVLDMQKSIEQLIAHNPNIKYVGWVQSTESYKYFFAADLAIFPGTHSTLWEEAIGLGMPGIFKRWKGIEHIDLNGNVRMLDDISKESLRDAILDIATNEQTYSKMSSIARNETNMKFFDYVDIAKRAIKTQ